MGNILRADVDPGLGEELLTSGLPLDVGTWEGLSGSAQGQTVWGRVGGRELLHFLGSQAQPLWAWR